MLPDQLDEFRSRGFCVLRRHLDRAVVEACAGALRPRLEAHLASGAEANRGPHRHFLPMPFDASFVRPVFFDPDILALVRALMDDRIVIDQWGRDVPLRGSEHQLPHADYRRPLFAECPDLVLPPYIVMVSFGLV